MVEFTPRDRLKILGGFGALALGACGGGSSSNSASAPIPGVTAPPSSSTPPPAMNVLTDGLLKDSFRNRFSVGAAMTSFQTVDGNMSGELAKSQFNSMTPEFELKADFLAPTEGMYNFETADRLVDWAIENGMEVRGHALLWHLTTPDYFLQGTPADIRARLEDYVTTVVNHFKGRIRIWDVVNEVVSDDLFRGDEGLGPDRRSNWYDAVGSADYIDWAFLAARAADPNALLFINDYETENPRKMAWFLEIINRLVDRNIPLDGVGHQFHVQLETPAEDVLTALDSVDNAFLGLINHVTELDISFYNNPGSCWEFQLNCPADLGPVAPPEMLATQARLMRELFQGFAARSSVESVTTWGVIDSDSWLNTTPVERFNYPLLFDRDGEPKSAFWAAIDPDYVI